MLCGHYINIKCCALCSGAFHCLLIFSAHKRDIIVQRNALTYLESSCSLVLRNQIGLVRVQQMKPPVAADSKCTIELPCDVMCTDLEYSSLLLAYAQK